MIAPFPAADIAACTRCGIHEHIDLLDGKIDPETEETIGIECIACYGPGWAPTDLGSFRHSIAPQLAPLYERWRTEVGR